MSFVGIDIFTPVTSNIGKTHLVSHIKGEEVRLGGEVTAICGGSVNLNVAGAGTYEPESTDRMFSEWRRLHKTHVTHLCGHCAKTLAKRRALALD